MKEIESNIYDDFVFDVGNIGEVRNVDVFFNVLQGLVVICDWIASSELFIKYNNARQKKSAFLKKPSLILCAKPSCAPPRLWSGYPLTRTDFGFIMV